VGETRGEYPAPSCRRKKYLNDHIFIEPVQILQCIVVLQAFPVKLSLFQRKIFFPLQNY
jgi:hypothetical protein